MFWVLGFGFWVLMHIGYVISRYPAVSHTFVQREVLGLRKLGWRVTTISIRRSGKKELLTEADRAEAKGTHVVVPANPWAFLRRRFGRCFFRRGSFCGRFRARGGRGRRG